MSELTRPDVGTCGRLKVTTFEPNQVQGYRRRCAEAPSIRRVDWITKVSHATGKRALELYVDPVAHMR